MSSEFSVRLVAMVRPSMAEAVDEAARRRALSRSAWVRQAILGALDDERRRDGEGEAANVHDDSGNDE